MEATASLSEDHRIIESMLPVLERMARQLEAGEFVRGYEIAAVLEFSREFVDGYHHRKEEQELFPRLEARGVPRDSGLVRDLLEEHAEGRRCARIITVGMSEAVAEDPGAEADFARYGREYVALLRRHIEKEDAQLWPLAERSLSDKDDARLAQAFAEMERATIGEGGRERFRQAARDLAAAEDRLQ